MSVKSIAMQFSILLLSLSVISGCTLVDSKNLPTSVFTGVYESNLSPEYRQKVNLKLAPLIEGDHLKGNANARISIFLGGDGKIESSRIDRTSGSAIADQNILNALTQLGSFPALISGKPLPKQLQLSIGKDGIRSAPTAIAFDRASIAYKPNANSYYLPRSKFAGEEGDVVITLIIGVDGVVEDVLLIKSSGFSRLDQSAARAGYDYRFNSYLIDGFPSRIAVNALFRFKVEKPPPIKSMDAIRTQLSKMN